MHDFGVFNAAYQIQNNQDITMNKKKGLFSWIPAGVICLAVFFALFGYLASQMGTANMLNTIMKTAHDLLLNTVFYLMAICVITGAIGKVFVEFGVVKIINDEIEMIDDYSFYYNNTIINFDYLICDDFKMLKNIEKTKMIIDEEPVTNFFQQTSLEHIYIGNIEIALDHLYNGDE